MFLAADAPAAGGSGLYTILMFVLLGVVFYFLLLRPQNKRRREAAAMQSNLSVGDEVQTVGGLFGTVVSVEEQVVTIEASPGIELRYASGAVARVVSKAGSAEDDERSDTPDNADAAKTIEQG